MTERELSGLMASPYFGMVREEVEDAASLLRRRLILVHELDKEIACARLIIDTMSEAQIIR